MFVVWTVTVNTFEAWLNASNGSKMTLNTIQSNKPHTCSNINQIINHIQSNRPHTYYHRVSNVSPFLSMTSHFQGVCNVSFCHWSQC